MGKPNYQYDETDCTGGINGQIDKATKNQCSEAVNVWAPEGVVEQRPGYVGADASLSNFFGYNGFVPATFAIITEDNSTTPATYTTKTQADVGGTVSIGDLRALAEGVPRDYIYIGIPDLTYNMVGYKLSTNPGSANTAATGAIIEYYNGTSWQYLTSSRWTNSATTNAYLGALGNDTFKFTAPTDWTQTTIAGKNYYFIRIGLVGADIDTGTLWQIVGFTAYRTAATSSLKLFESIQFTQNKAYLSLISGVLVGGTSVAYLARVDSVAAVAVAVSKLEHYPASVAPIIAFNKAFIAYGNAVYVYDNGAQTLAAAVVETDPALLTDFSDVDLLAAWPTAKFIDFYKGIVWAANLQENQFQIRWSADTSSITPGYDIWPVLNTEVLIDGDNSPITGIKGFGQNMVVFKNDSIYEMIFAGVGEATNLALFAPEKRVSGVGTVAHHSIREVLGHLFFLAEDGVYAYNGSPQVQNLGHDKQTGVDRIKHIIKRITPSRRAFANAVHWSTKHCYLLAVALDGSVQNNAVLVYDYENDAWWLWDNIEAQFFVLDENSNDDQQLYFANNYGQLFKLEASDADYGTAIESYVVTREMAGSKSTVRARVVEVEATNTARDLALEITANGAPFGASLGQSSTLDYTDAAEKEYGEAVYGTDKYTVTRDRLRDRGVLLSGKFFKVKVTHDEKNAPLELGAIRVGVVPTGKR